MHYWNIFIAGGIVAISFGRGVGQAQQTVVGGGNAVVILGRAKFETAAVAVGIVTVTLSVGASLVLGQAI